MPSGSVTLYGQICVRVAALKASIVFTRIA
jgi:hypothetical protein